MSSPSVNPAEIHVGININENKSGNSKQTCITRNQKYCSRYLYSPYFGRSFCKVLFPLRHRYYKKSYSYTIEVTVTLYSLYQITVNKILRESPEKIN